MEEYIPETETPDERELNDTIIESKSYYLSLLNEEYKLTMNYNKSILEFILKKKNSQTNYEYKEKFDLLEMNEILISSYKEIKEVFNFFNKILNKNNVKLVKSKNKNAFNLNFKIINNFYQEIEKNIELRQNKIKNTNGQPENEFIDEEKIKDLIATKLEESKKEIIKEYKIILEEKLDEKDREIKKLKETIDTNKNIFEQKIQDLEKNISILMEKLKEKEQEQNQKKEYYRSQTMISPYPPYPHYPPPQIRYIPVSLPFHKHPLNYQEYLNDECNICQNQILNKSGYKCNYCSLVLDSECYNKLLYGNKKKFLHTHPLFLILKMEWKCDVCNNTFKNKYSFNCNQCDFDVCIKCYMEK